MQRTDRTGATETLDEVNRVALQALSFVVPSLQQGDYVRKPLESYVSQLYAALLRSSARDVDSIVNTMRNAHIPADVIAETYAPVLARRMGDDWLSDSLDFSAVTLASSRLQGMVRRLEEAWIPTVGAFDSARPACLVGVPHGEQHTLGSTILAGQLRKRGIYVHLSLDLTPETLSDHMKKQPFAAVMLSLSCVHHSGLIRNLADAAHRQNPSTPVIFGGPLLDSNPEVFAETRVDFATSDLAEAMTFAGLSAVSGMSPCAAKMSGGILT